MSLRKKRLHLERDAGFLGAMKNEKLSAREKAERARQLAIRLIMQARRRARVLTCSRQAMQSKQRMIAAGQGKHGRSMSPALLARHAAA